MICFSCNFYSKRREDNITILKDDANEIKIAECFWAFRVSNLIVCLAGFLFWHVYFSVLFYCLSALLLSI